MTLEVLFAEEGRFPGELITKDVVVFWKENNFCYEKKTETLKLFFEEINCFLKMGHSSLVFPQ